MVNGCSICSPALHDTPGPAAATQRAFQAQTRQQSRLSDVEAMRGQLQRGRPKTSAVRLAPLQLGARSAACTAPQRPVKGLRGSGLPLEAICETCCSRPWRISNQLSQPQKTAWHRWFTAQDAAAARCPMHIDKCIIQAVLECMIVEARLGVDKTGVSITQEPTRWEGKPASTGGDPPARLRDADRV